MKALYFWVILIIGLSNSVYGVEIDDVTCKGMLKDFKNDKTEIFELQNITETTDKIIYSSPLHDDFMLQVVTRKGIYHFQPYIHFAQGITLTTGGFFPASRVIKLNYQQMDLETQELAREINVRCCRDCSFNDW